MDLGTGKDLAEYGEIQYHLIDLAAPGDEEYHLARFVHDAYLAMAGIIGRGRLPILCGGTALYLDASSRAKQRRRVRLKHLAQKRWLLP